MLSCCWKVGGSFLLCVAIDKRQKIAKLEGWEHSSPDEIAEFTREFDQVTIHLIDTDQEPAYIRVAGRRTNIPKYSISTGRLKLTG